MILKHTPGHISRENYNSNRYMQPQCSVALFTTTKTWKQPTVHQQATDKHVVNTHHGAIKRTK